MMVSLAPSDQPQIWRLARLHFDDVRKQFVLLYPEGVLLLNDSGAAILALCDGIRTIQAIGDELSLKADQDVHADIVEYLDALLERGLVRVARATTEPT